MIRIIDYGLGNVQAFLNTYKRLGIPAGRAENPAALDGASHVILPGVGAFDHAMELFDQSGFRGPMERLIVTTDLRVLGVCVGMQMLAEGSTEGQRPGLGWVPGMVRKIDTLESPKRLPMPHMGWNDVEAQGDGRLFGGLDDLRFYFLHSYFFECRNKDQIIATTEYGQRFCCAVANDKVYGVQFHPEKSHHWGQALLCNFATI
jgi:glutamine amidotransferase